MYSHLEIITFMLMVVQNVVWGLPPLHLTIECGSDETDLYSRPMIRPKPDLIKANRLDLHSFCNLIHSAIPKTIKDGKFILLEPDLEGHSDTQIPFSVTPPQGFIPKLGSRLKRPKLKVPKLNVPKLKSVLPRSQSAPIVGSSMSFASARDSVAEGSSAERMEKFKKGMQKMLHVVKVLGQVDQYLSERTRILIDKLSKTFAD